MSPRLVIVRPEPLEPIRVMDAERMPPAPPFWLWLLLVIPFWWALGYVIWSHI